MRKRKLHIAIIIVILIVIACSIIIFTLSLTNPTVAYLKDSTKTLTEATYDLMEMKNNTSLNNDNTLNYNQGSCYEYGEKFENLWSEYNNNYKNSSSTKDYHNKMQAIESKEKAVYNLLTNGVTLYLNGSNTDKNLAIIDLKEAYSLLDTLNNETVPNTVNKFNEEINKLQK